MVRKSNAEYQREYRARRKSVGQEFEVIPRAALPQPVFEDEKLPAAFTTWKQVSAAAREPERLPRSNYYSNPSEPNGWTQTIQGMDPKLALRILGKIAPPRRIH